MRPTVLLLLTTLSAALPGTAAAQTLTDLVEGIRRGGGWIEVPIREGRGETRTAPVPTLGLTLSGCIQVWGGHSGRWSIRARDLVGEERLEVDVRPGESVPFTYSPGARAQLEVRYQWSEPRDTTLLLWVGLKTSAREGRRDPCDPLYGEATGAAAGLATAETTGAGRARARAPYLAGARLRAVRTSASRSPSAMSSSHEYVGASGLPRPIGPYSPAVAYQRLVFVSGQGATDPATGKLAGHDVETQTEQVFRNIQVILDAAGTDLSRVLRCGVFLVDLRDFEKMNAVYTRAFGDHRPARTTVQVAALPDPELRVEIDAVAYLP
ncbi:MAG TPA: Rid family detoxifying hydrolase [Longimicrobiales bacterium]|nr:Rid family detoxifying hydrolase [Longimicrobiales bacterium]